MTLNLSGPLRDYGSQIHRRINLTREERAYDLISAFNILANAVIGTTFSVSDASEFNWKGHIDSIEDGINPDKILHKRGLGEFRKRFHQIFKEEGIEFRGKIYRKTIYQVLLGTQDKNIEKGFSNNIEDYEKFWEDYNGKFIFEAEMKKKNMRKRIAIEKAISNFNRTSSKMAGFRLIGKNWKEILQHVDKSHEKRKTHGKNLKDGERSIHLLYGTIDQIKELLKQSSIREVLEKNITQYGWQNGWKMFAKEYNTIENGTKNGFLIPSDIRLIRDLLRINTIRKDIISPYLGLTYHS